MDKIGVLILIIALENSKNRKFEISNKTSNI